MISSEYEYLSPDDFVTFHEEDINLDTVVIETPQIEEWYSHALKRPVSYREAIEMMDGYGLAPEDQYFRPQVMPPRLKGIYQSIARRMEKSARDVSREDVHEELDKNRIYYREEIEWIQIQIARKYLGYWFFNNGKPTYITGTHYFFLNFWKLNNAGVNNNLAYYRDKQRRQSLYYKWAYKYDKLVFSHRVTYRKGSEHGQQFFNDMRSAREFRDDCNKTGFAFIDVIEGTPDSIRSAGKRTVHGVVQPKTRREGYTSYVCCEIFCQVTDTPGKEAFIQALNEDDSKKEVFGQKLVPAIFQLPFFFVPYHDNDKQEKPSEEYVFQYPQKLLRLETAGVIPPCHGGTIRPFSSKHRAIDGKRGGVLYKDECGKAPEGGKEQDVEVWWNNVARRTLEVGNFIVGFAMLGSTVGDMSGGGGASFKRLAEMSHFRKRNNNGTTVTGLVNLFFAAYDGLEGFIDKYGMSVIEDPVTPVMGQNGKLITMGARRYLKNIRDGLLKEGNIVGYVNETREMPWTWEEAFTPSASDVGFPIKEMRERHGQLSFLPTPLYTRHRLEWVSEFGGDVEMIPDENGQWFIVDEFKLINGAQFLNKKRWSHEANSWMPDFEVCNRMYMGVDPFRFNDKNTSGKGKKSNGSIAIFWKYDESIDGGRKKEDRLTEDFMAVYNYRVYDKKLFCEEALKAAILWGCHANIELDEPIAVEMFQEWGFEEYVLREIGPDGKPKSHPGVRANPGNKQNLMGTMMTFFTRNVHRVKLPMVIEWWMNIKGPTDLTNNDGCAATGWAAEGLKNPMPKELAEERGRDFFFMVQNYDRVA